MTSSTPFEIKVAVIGCNYAAKAALLNGLLGEAYLPTWGEFATHDGVVDCFRIVDGAKENIQPASLVQSTIVDRALASTSIRLASRRKVAVLKTEFDVAPIHDLTPELRGDTTFLFVNTPLSSRATKNELGESYFTENSMHFDRVIAVVDLHADDEKDCNHLLRSLKVFLKNKPNSSITMICNVAGKRIGLTKEIVGKIDRIKEKVFSFNIWATSERAKAKVDHGIVTSAAAPTTVNILSYDSDDDDIVVPPAGCAGEQDLFNATLPLAIELIESPLSVDSDDKLIQKVREIAGDIQSQTELLKGQRAAALARLDAISPFAKDLFTTYERFMHLDADDGEWKSSCVHKFWKLYHECEVHALSKFETEMDPSRLALPMEQLVEFNTWVTKLKMEEEIKNLETTSREFIKQQLTMVLHKNSLWSFDDWYNKMNTNQWKCISCQDWLHVSPSDWNTIISSLLLTSSDCYFYESFGQEKILLERARFLSGDRLVKAKLAVVGGLSTQFSAADGCPSLEHSLDGSYEKGCFQPRYPTTFDCVVRFEVPDKLSSKNHWGHVAWKYCNLMRLLKH